jgi:hypothetical protein
MPSRPRKSQFAMFLFAAFIFALGGCEYVSGNKQAASEDVSLGVILTMCPVLLYIFARHNMKNPANPIRYWQQVCCAAVMFFVVTLCSILTGSSADFYVVGLLASWLLLCCGGYYYLHDRERIQHKFYD